MEGLRKCKGRYGIYDGRHYTQEFELGYFHGWGTDYMEYEAGPGNYMVAIVELPDGKIILPKAEDITFLEPAENFRSPLAEILKNLKHINKDLAYISSHMRT